MKKLFILSRFSLILLLFISLAIPTNAKPRLSVNSTFPYSQAVPDFPKKVIDYSLIKKRGYDYVRVFAESKWVVPIEEFDPERNGGATMSCQPYYWVIRWRSNNPDVEILATTGITDFDKFDRVTKIKRGGAGVMSGYSCLVPAFKFGGALNGNRSNLVDVNFEYRLWEYRPKI